MLSGAIATIINEHLQEALFLWLQRADAACAPQYSPKQFADLDERLEAHIDGLRVAGEEGWRIAQEALASEGPEDFFPAAILALEANDHRFDGLVEHAADLPEIIPGLISALGWVSPQFLGGRVKAMFDDESPIKQKLGIAACALHRRDPGETLLQFLNSTFDSIRIRAFRTAGELGRKDAMPQLSKGLDHVKPEARFWAAWSSVLLGDRNNALQALCNIALEESPRQKQALQLALLAMDMEAGNAMVKLLDRLPHEQRLIIFGLGYIGSVQSVPWLIEQMANSQLARIAAEAFVNITGADFNLDQLEAEPPEGFDEGPTEDPDDEVVDVPEDIALPWPDIEKIKKWWNKHSTRFEPGSRYFIGQPLSSEQCIKILKEGYQRQRVAAAQHLSLLNPGMVLFPTSAPAWRQKRLLEKL